MSNYAQKRQFDLQTALSAIDAGTAVDDDPALRAEIEAEANAWSGAPTVETSDRGVELALLAWLATSSPPATAASIVTAVNNDPMIAVLGRDPSLTLAASTDVVLLSHSRRLTLAEIAEIRTKAGSVAAYEEILFAAYRMRLGLPVDKRPYLFRDVAVLLPLRLETIFRQEGAKWTMQLRIVPDEASILRDEPLPAEQEVESLRAMWQAIVDQLPPPLVGAKPHTWLDTPDAQLAWQDLCSRLGNERAAWLAGSYPPTIVGDQVTIPVPAFRENATVNRVGNFPRQIEIWAKFGNADPQRIDTTIVDVDALFFDVIGARREVDGTLVEEKDRWWVSWQAAQAVGLGRVITLPDGDGPADIRVLYAIGLGEENPADHFRAKIDAGEMAILPLGAATNTVDGQKAADLCNAAAGWRQVVKRRLEQLAFGTFDDPVLSHSLAGSEATLPAFPRAETIPDLDHQLVSALWPALWGHQMRDLWGCLTEADRLASWAIRYLRPEGPLPPVRLGDQPYGLLPTSALTRWKVAGEEGALAKFEKRLVRGLQKLRDHWAATVPAQSPVVGADTAKLLDLISRDAVSADYAYRLFVPVPLWKALLGATSGVDPLQVDAWVANVFKPLYSLLERDPAAPPGVPPYLTAGGYNALEIPLVLPKHWPYWYFKLDEHGQPVLDDNGQPVTQMSAEDGLAKLFQDLLERGHNISWLMEIWRNVLPDSLLVRLLIYAGGLSAAAAVQADLGTIAPLLEPLVGDSAYSTLVEDLARTYDPRVPHISPAGDVRRWMMEGLERLLKYVDGQPPEANVLGQVERAFRATLDTATHRIDPWITAMAARRLEHLRERPDSRFRLGVYGWVDGPMLGAPGPSEGGLLHAPSHAQALTAVILRDKFISEKLESPGTTNLWSMQLESQGIRMAEEIAEEVRLGSHLFEVLGRQVERIIASDGVVSASAAVDAVRQKFPLRAGQIDRGTVCHGQDALTGLLPPKVPPIALTSRQIGHLTLLKQSIDTYGDLLVAEAVHQVVTGHADIAGAAMDAAAALGAPPTLAFTETPLAGESLVTTVIFAIPFHPAESDPDPQQSPALIADGSVPRALEQFVGQANQWKWDELDEDGNVLSSTTLVDLGLEPIDTLVLSSQMLEDLVRFRLGIAREAALGGTGRLRHEAARRIVSTLAGQPALLRELAPSSESSADAQATRELDADIMAELRNRYAVLRESAQQLCKQLTAAIKANDSMALAKGLFLVLRWGITPMVTRAEQTMLFAAMLDGTPPVDVTLLPRVVGQARDALKGRLEASPDANTREPIARKIAELAAPEGQLAILSCIPAATLASRSRIQTHDTDESLAEDWLPVIASVRSSLARVEALQLEAEFPTGTPPTLPACQMWSSASGDPWLVSTLANIRAQRRAPGGDDPRIVLPRLTIALTLGQVWPTAGAVHQDVAVSLIDSWAEAVPRPEQTSTAAFGFNAPAARPPQAILLAVPPDLNVGFGVEFTTEDLVGILAETRELAHARAAEAEQLGEYLTAVPTSMLDGTGRTGIRLDAGVTFPT